MKEEAIAELERLEREASKAPWELRDGIAIADDGLPYQRGYSNDIHVGEHAPDAALIVAARNALPAMLAECREAERLRERVRVLREALQELLIQTPEALLYEADGSKRRAAKQRARLVLATAPEGKP